MKSSTPIIVRLLLNQFVMSIFGTMLTMSTIMSDEKLCAAFSSISLFLYFFLIYHTLWDKGASDVISSQYTHKKSISRGFIISFLASIPTIVLTVIFSVITKQMTATSYFADILYTLSKLAISLGLQGMYYGIANIFSFHFGFYIITIFPAIIVGGIAYILGYKNIRIIPEKKKQ